MNRTERQLFQIGDDLIALDEAIRLAREELVYHDHLNDDAQRDAAVSESPLDRADARDTQRDVSRMKSHIASLQKERDKLARKREKLLEKLGS